jgi:hypothetical protein
VIEKHPSFPVFPFLDTLFCVLSALGGFVIYRYYVGFLGQPLVIY